MCTINPCLHAEIVVLQQYRAGVNPPKLTLLYSIGNRLGDSYKMVSRSIGKIGEGVGGARKSHFYTTRKYCWNIRCPAVARQQAY